MINKKIIYRLLAIGATLAVAFGLLFFSRFSSAGSDPVSISIDGQKPWQAVYRLDAVAPGESRQINFVIENTGEYPANIWNKITATTTDTGIQSEPECAAEGGAWNNGQKICEGAARERNNIDTQIDYRVKTELCRVGNLFCEPMVLNSSSTIAQIKGQNISLGIAAPGDKIKVYQTYGLKDGAGNEYQGDKMDFAVTISADDEGSVSRNRSLLIDEPGADINDQYGYFHDYSNARVEFSYSSPSESKLAGAVIASGLKPYATYQVKFEGKPTCEFAAGGNNLANEYIGYKGRWTCVDCSGDANSRNRTDLQYESQSIYRGGSECIAGYLVWGFFTADGAGNVVADAETASSYHVLWCNGGVCGSAINSNLANLDAAHPGVMFCAAGNVDGQIERGTCGGLALEPGDYDLLMTLTEESFHQGSWSTVLKKDISFTIK